MRSSYEGQTQRRVAEIVILCPETFDDLPRGYQGCGRSFACGSSSAHKIKPQICLIGSTTCVTGGWGEKGLETKNCQSSEPSPKNTPSPSRPGHAVLGRFSLLDFA